MKCLNLNENFIEYLYFHLKLVLHNFFLIEFYLEILKELFI